MRVIGISIAMSLGMIAFGQNLPRFSQINVAKAMLNPAAYGVDAKFSTDILYRNQWMGTPGAPSTVGLVSGYELTPSHAVGLTAVNDMLGVTRTTSVNAGYAYRLIYNEEQFLAFGANVGIQNVNSDYSRLFVLEQGDEAFMDSYSQWRFNAGFGMYYNGPKMYLGFSIPTLLQNVHRGPDNGFNIDNWHYYFTGGFYLARDGAKYVMNPCFQVKAVNNAPIQGDLLIRNIFNGKFAFTLGYRTENALVAGFDFMVVNRARFGYSFNYNFGPISKVMGTSHEIFLGLGLPYYYGPDRFHQRKYVNKKGGFYKDYRRQDRRYGKRR